jgi:hypothetical protein
METIHHLFVLDDNPVTVKVLKYFKDNARFLPQFAIRLKITRINKNKLKNKQLLQKIKKFDINTFPAIYVDCQPPLVYNGYKEILATYNRNFAKAKQYEQQQQQIKKEEQKRKNLSAESWMQDVVLNDTNWNTDDSMEGDLDYNALMRDQMEKRKNGMDQNKQMQGLSQKNETTEYLRKNRGQAQQQQSLEDDDYSGVAFDDNDSELDALLNGENGELDPDLQMLMGHIMGS